MTIADGSAYFDALETRDPAGREAAQGAHLAAQIAHAKATAPAYARLLRDVVPETITDRTALAALPLTRKSDLADLQAEMPPFGGLATIAPEGASHLFASPGPIYESAAPVRDPWRLGRALYAAGFRPGDIVHNAFSYHLTPGGWMLDGGLRALGCAVIPAGVAHLEQQLQAIAHYRPCGYAGAPDFLKVLLDKGGELDLDCSSISKALVSGGALFPALREDYRARGIAMLQCYATADVGLIAYETADAAGALLEGMVVDEGLILEIVRPGTGDPVPDGEVGEVVVTAFDQHYPLIRFATGDLSAVLPGASACGRTNRRIKGWMGRADQTAKVKGQFVYPRQVAEAVKRHPGVTRARLVVERAGESDRLTLKCATEAARTPEPGLDEALAADFRAVTGLRAEVLLVPAGDLPNDGQVIEDLREFD